MNLLVGLVVVVCLVVCEFDSQSLVEDVWTRVAAMFFVALSVPGLAVFQTHIVTRRLQDLGLAEKDATLRRLATCHTAVWLVASLMIVWAVKWQTVVRSNWGLGHWPMIDEILILLPIVLSLVASWAIFYDVQRPQSERVSKTSSRRSWRIVDPRRLAFVTVRFRVYFGMSLFPALIIVLMRDLVSLNNSTPFASAIGYVATLVLVLIGFPYLLGLFLNVQPIVDQNLSSDLVRFCKEHALQVATIRVWHTDNRVSNAMVVGLVPWFRRIILTDGMLTAFPRHELLAILRHEAGHIRRFHLPIRIGFALLPLVVWGVAEQMGISVHSKLNTVFAEMGIRGQPEWLLLLLIYVAYLTATVSWLSTKMEFEADRFAVFGGLDPNDVASERVKTRANELLDALTRFASQCPRQLDRISLMHPSLRQRMKQIVQLRDEPESRHALERNWHRQQLIFLLGLMSVSLAVLMI